MQVSPSAKAHRILVLNAKGGCGKTTVATNLACQYASENQNTVIIDYDPQASSTQWLEARPANLPTIHSVAAYQKTGTVTRTWQLRLPQGTTRVIVDTPARLDVITAAKLIKDSDTILIPVLASPIDTRAATLFLGELMNNPEYRQCRNKRIAVLGNRIRRNTRAYANLLEYLKDLHIPFLTSLRDTQNYVRAAEEGCGVQELNRKSAEHECLQWQSLARWIDGESEAAVGL